MIVSPKFVNAFVLRMPEEKEQEIRSQIVDFYSRPANLRKMVVLHIGLFVIYLDGFKLKLMLQFLKSWRPKFSAVEIKIGSLKKISVDYIGFSVSSPLLKERQETIIESVKQITKGSYDSKYTSYDLSEKEKEYLEIYGYHRIKEFFDPHITIGKYTDQKTRDEEFLIAPKLQGTLKFTELVFDQAEIGAGKQADVLWRLPLK